MRSGREPEGAEAEPPESADLAAALAVLADPDLDLDAGTPGAGPAHAELALRVLGRVGIGPERYDTYLLFDTAVGGLYVACGAQGVSGALLSTVVGGAREFEARHRAVTGRSALPALQAPPGVRTALSTGGAHHLPLDLRGMTGVERQVLAAVRAVPRGQLRPLSWIAREADVADGAGVLAALARNPVQLLVPCHRVTHEDGTPCDAAHGARAGRALRAAEGIEPCPGA